MQVCFHVHQKILDESVVSFVSQIPLALLCICKNTDMKMYSLHLHDYYALENAPERIQEDSSDVGMLCKQEHVSGLCVAAS